MLNAPIENALSEVNYSFIENWLSFRKICLDGGGRICGGNAAAAKAKTNLKVEVLVYSLSFYL